MLAPNSIWFYLSFVAVPQMILSTRVNTTSSDGKIFISGDHNEVVVSMARETKIALAAIKRRLESVEKKDQELSTKLFQLLDDHLIRGKLNAMNQTIETLSETVEKKDNIFSRKLDALDKRIVSLEKIQGNLNSMNQTIETLTKTVESQDNNIGGINKSNTGLFTQVQAISQRVSVLERNANNYALLFPRKGTSDYVIITRGMPSLKAVTVCLWMKSSDKGNAGTPLSYNVPGRNINELYLFDYRKFHFAARDRERVTSVSANDGIWHHICATWENTAGSWKLYKDGKVAAAGKGLRKGYVIRGGGTLVLGQEQDSMGGSFDASQCFIGEMTGVNIWDHVIKEQEIMRMSKSCLAGLGNVFQWRDFKPHAKGSVKIIKPSC